MQQATNPKGKPLPAAVRAKLAAIIEDVGEHEAGRRLGISRQTLARAVAGLPVYRGTHAIVFARLKEQP